MIEVATCTSNIQKSQGSKVTDDSAIVLADWMWLTL
jgi:hypothetical protein